MHLSPQCRVHGYYVEKLEKLSESFKFVARIPASCRRMPHRVQFAVECDGRTKFELVDDGTVARR